MDLKIKILWFFLLFLGFYLSFYKNYTPISSAFPEFLYLQTHLNLISRFFWEIFLLIFNFLINKKDFLFIFYFSALYALRTWACTPRSSATTAAPTRCNTSSWRCASCPSSPVSIWSALSTWTRRRGRKSSTRCATRNSSWVFPFF